MGTDAPDVDEENVIARPSIGYDDMWAKTLLESTELEVHISKLIPNYFYLKSHSLIYSFCVCVFFFFAGR